VLVRGPLGRYPAWFVPGDRKTWVVVLHGFSMSRIDNVRVLPALRNAGYPTLTITYRNDAGAPEDPSGLLRYGLTEWKDLEAGVEYAIGRGSAGVVLMGVSMGGGVIAAFLERSDLAEEVRALVLDAPMLDFSQTIDDNASRERLPVIGTPLPPGVTATAKMIARLRWGIEWSDLDYLEHPSMFSMPILVFHGTGDETVPIGTSDELKRLVPQTQLVRCPGAGHIECWNRDPRAYESKMISFLDDATS
jgi:pimeloyl-ACP methyl ester carboxylesterase